MSRFLILLVEVETGDSRSIVGRGDTIEAARDDARRSTVDPDDAPMFVSYEKYVAAHYDRGYLILEVDCEDEDVRDA